MAFDLEVKFVERAEAELGARLPDSYREALMDDNGGEVEAGGDVWWLHPIYDTSDRKRIKRTCNHIIAETKSRGEWAIWPENGLDIGGNGGGDALLFLRSGETYGPEVFVWSHEGGSPRKVADDFSELKRE